MYSSGTEISRQARDDNTRLTPPLGRAPTCRRGGVCYKHLYSPKKFCLSQNGGDSGILPRLRANFLLNLLCYFSF
jgi:hypothetical protein